MWRTLKAEYQAFYVMGHSPAMAGCRSVFQYVTTVLDGRPFGLVSKSVLYYYERYMRNSY